MLFTVVFTEDERSASRLDATRILLRFTLTQHLGNNTRQWALQVLNDTGITFFDIHLESFDVRCGLTRLGLA